MDYLCANFSLPRPPCSRVTSDVRNRQTDVRQKHRLMPRLLGAGHNNARTMLQAMMRYKSWLYRTLETLTFFIPSLIISIPVQRQHVSVELCDSYYSDPVGEIFLFCVFIVVLIIFLKHLRAYNKMSKGMSVCGNVMRGILRRTFMPSVRRYCWLGIRKSTWLLRNIAVAIPKEFLETFGTQCKR